MIHIIIPVHNRLNFTKDCLNSLKKQKTYSQFNLIVVDDGSTDETRDFLKKNFPEVKILRGNGSLYWGGSINLGVKFVLKICKDQDWVLIVNNDVEFDFNTISVLIDISKKKDRKVLSSALTLNANDKKTIIKSGTIVESWLLNKTNHIFKGLNISQVNNKNPVKVDLLTGRCLLHPIEIFKIAGNYDSKNFLHYGGDDEFSMRVKKYGFQTLVCPHSIVFLKTLNQENKKKISLQSLFFTFFNIKSSSNIISKLYFTIKVVPFHAKLSFFIIGILKSFYVFFKNKP
jgi:GT2 family glycosyltransferase